MTNKMSLIFILFLILSSTSLLIPVIDHAILIPIGLSNSTLISNHDCYQCLCRTMLNSAILNCFNNNTCQIFDRVPRRYRLEFDFRTRLYFPQRQLPNPSQCCMPNVSELITKLQNGTRTIIDINGTRDLLIDHQKRLVVADSNPGYLRIYNTTNLNPILHLRINISRPFTLAQQNEAYYIGLQNNSILVINSNSLSILNIINSPYLSGIRDMIFLQNGEIMIVVSTEIHSLIFFKRTNVSFYHYTFFFNQTVKYFYPHGLLHINDSFFYATSWANNTIYSYTFVNETFWKETLIIDAGLMTNMSGGNHVRIDECGRFWFALGPNGIFIFDSQGELIESCNYSLTNIFDLIIDENYVVYLSDIGKKQVVRIDPNIQCHG